jgi:hypothetical protein
MNESQKVKLFIEMGKKGMMVPQEEWDILIEKIKPLCESLFLYEPRTLASWYAGCIHNKPNNEKNDYPFYVTNATQWFVENVPENFFTPKNT